MAASIAAHCRTLSEGDKAGWLALWAEDAVLEDPVGVDTYRGRNALATIFWGLIEELSPMKLWLERDVIVCGDEAVAILHGVVSRNGKLTRVGPIVDHFVFDEDGLIASMRAFWKYD
jgi:steroid delta-isomerase